MIEDNILLDSDVYKHTHWKMIPKNVKYTYAYQESRGVSDKGVPPETLVFGYQYYIKRYLEGRVITERRIDVAKILMAEVFGTDEYFNEHGWKYILENYDGNLPILIKAVPEGTVVPSHNVLMTIENLDSHVPWLTTFVETLLMRSWYPISVATTSYGIKKLIASYAELTGGNPDVSFHLNDFGSRGVSSKESAGVGGMAHLINFRGSDTIEAVRYAKEYYNAGFAMASVAASEHSETLLFGEEHEKDAYEHFIEAFPSGILSIVSDTYDLNVAVDKIFGVELRDKILERDGRLVVRPDSGYPPHITIQVLKSLYKHFGGSTNDKGYINLNPKVGVIYGDYIAYGMIDDILAAMEREGFSTDNVVFGMGGGLLQQVNRDTFKFAIKNSACADEHQTWRGIAKNPLQDPSKKSKKGRLQLIMEDGKFKTQEYDYLHEDKDLLVPIFKNGKILKEYEWEDIRERAASFM
jgi:nicotinamide phosphoribosyltransferase